MSEIVNKGIDTIDHFELEAIPLRKCKVCNKLPNWPHVERRKNFDFCVPGCWLTVFNAVEKNLEKILDLIFGDSAIEI